jgi:phage gp36-like protein
MAYATQADLLQRVTLQELIQLTDDSRPPVAVNVTIVGNELDEGSAAVDSYCRKRYSVPLQASTDVIRIVRDIAVYQLYSRRPQQKMPDQISKRYDQAMAFLKDIASGKASLDQPEGVTVQQVSAGNAVTPARKDERFSDRNLEGYV